MGAQTVSEEELDALFAKLKQAVPESKAEELLSCRSVIRGLTGGGARSMSSEASEVKEKLLMRGVCFSSAPSENQEEVEATAGKKTKQKKAHLQARRELLSEGDELHTDTIMKKMRSCNTGRKMDRIRNAITDIIEARQDDARPQQEDPPTCPIDHEDPQRRRPGGIRYRRNTPPPPPSPPAGRRRRATVTHGPNG